MTVLEFLKLSWEIQVALAGGYAAYALAYTGLRERQRAIDVAFISLVFSLAASLMLWLLKDYNPIVASGAAITASVMTAIVWRKYLRPVMLWMLRKFDITWENDDPSALATLSGSTDYRTVQIAVLLDDGTWLRCDNAQQFYNSPFGPCQIGPNGDVALYLTHEESASGDVKELKSVRDPYYGDRITYVPASRIKRITIRHSAVSHLSMGAAPAAEPAGQSLASTAAPSAAP